VTPVDPSPVMLCAKAWRPRAAWASTIRPAYELLTAGAIGLEAARAWADVAMMMGDSRAAPLALVVCLHAETLLPPEGDQGRLASHKNLCLLDLGLAASTVPGPIKIVELGQPGAVEDRPGEVAAWLARALIPFDDDLARAARYALHLAAVRTGVIEGPEPVP